VVFVANHNCIIMEIAKFNGMNSLSLFLSLSMCVNIISVFGCITYYWLMRVKLVKVRVGTQKLSLCIPIAAVLLLVTSLVIWVNVVKVRQEYCFHCAHQLLWLLIILDLFCALVYAIFLTTSKQSFSLINNPCEFCIHRFRLTITSSFCGFFF